MCVGEESVSSTTERGRERENKRIKAPERELSVQSTGEWNFGSQPAEQARSAVVRRSRREALRAPEDRTVFSQWTDFIQATFSQRQRPKSIELLLAIHTYSQPAHINERLSHLPSCC